MNFQSIENYITQFPIYQYTFLSIDDIEFNDKVRTICKRECPRYGKSWSCPPAVGTVDKCRERCQQYTHALLFSSAIHCPRIPVPSVRNAHIPKNPVTTRI